MIRNLVLRKGIDWDDEFQITDEGSAMDLSGCTLVGHCRRDEKADSPLVFAFTFNYDAVTRFVKVSVPGTSTSNVVTGLKPDDRASQFYYDYLMTWPGGTVDVIQEGKLTIERVITRP